ncbi:MAG: rRNA maturation RNase YbeY [Beijerinckiaceae bacterium]|nr:rRNA maturation RNase YbeY [Beijerinckiaceae bacterium]
MTPAPHLDIDISIESALWQAIPDLETRIEAAIRAAAGLAAVALKPGAEVSLLLTHDAQIRELNRAWRQQDKATNVLSFPATTGGDLASAAMLGDIVLACETLQREAEQDGKTLPDHLSHLVVHGFLHLLGFDHETDDEAQEMEDLERSVLRELGIADPYADKS